MPLASDQTCGKPKTFTPALLFNRSEGFRKHQRDCDNPQSNFQKIRNERLWRELEAKRQSARTE